MKNLNNSINFEKVLKIFGKLGHFKIKIFGIGNFFNMRIKNQNIKSQNQKQNWQPYVVD